MRGEMKISDTGKRGALCCLHRRVPRGRRRVYARGSLRGACRIPDCASLRCPGYPSQVGGHTHGEKARRL